MLFVIETKDTGRSTFRYKKIAEKYRCDAMLLRFGDCNILWDVDFACTAPFVIDALRSELRGETLDYILLSHSHYDHCAGAPYIQEVFPEVKVIAAVHAAEVFRKESTRARMLRLDDALAVRRGHAPAPRETFAKIHADIAVKDNDVLMLGSHPVRVIEVPGHTRDSVCYWFTEENVLLGTETLGVYRHGEFGLAMLVGYGLTVSSMQKVMALPIGAFMLPHGAGIIYGEEACRAYLAEAVRGAEKTKDSIVSVFEEGNWAEETIEKATRMIVETGDYYDPSMIKARELNGTIMVRQMYEEFQHRIRP